MDPLTPVFRFGLPVLIVFTIGLLGRTRRLGFWWAFALSIVLTPIGGFLVTMLSGPKPIGKQNRRKKMVKAVQRQVNKVNLSPTARKS